MRRLYLIAFVCLCFVGCISEAEPLSNVVSSPDGRVVVEVETNDEGAACYTLTFGDEVVIDASPLGIRLAEADFTRGLEVVDLKHSRANTTWEPVWGERAVVVD